MKADSEIGRVVSIDTAEVRIKLDSNLKGMSRSTYEGAQEVGRINSYVIIPVGTQRLVAMVTRVTLAEDSEVKADRKAVSLPAARRMMSATLIGTIKIADSRRRLFQQGVSNFPVLDSPVHLIERADLDAIFGRAEDVRPENRDDPGYCIPIGESVIEKGRPVRIDPDAFFGKHAAVLGSTGSGKSCTIATLLQSIHDQPDVKRTTCVILDTNGEYRAAFPDGENKEIWKGRTLYIPSDSGEKNKRLAIPYWFMNSEDFVRLFQASAGTQRPVLLDVLRQAKNKSNENNSVKRSVDSPSYFEKSNFHQNNINDVAIQSKTFPSSRVYDYLGTMMFRIERLLSDKRFDFLFGPVGSEWKNPSHALAAFLRDTLGIGALEDTEFSDEQSVPKSLFPFYDRQREGSDPVDIVILDFSLLAAEVLENVTALIVRLILEFLQRLGEYGGENARGSLPVVLVLEEAQNYIRPPRFAEEESIAQTVFERIAREGRKYGLSLVVASQRPSELSKTVLSQCNSFIVHRLQNPEDLRYFKEIVPSIYGPMLEQIPALSPQNALVLGECVPAPALVKIRDARPMPRSQDPKFYNYWVDKSPAPVNVEDICDRWEDEGAGKNAKESGQGTTQSGGSGPPPF